MDKELFETMTNENEYEEDRYAAAVEIVLGAVVSMLDGTVNPHMGAELRLATMYLTEGELPSEDTE